MMRIVNNRSEAMNQTVKRNNSIDMYKYIADQSTLDALKFVDSKGYRKPKSKYELSLMLTDFVSRGGDDELRELVLNTHPDKELFDSISSNDKKMSNADGGAPCDDLPCTGCSSADGSGATKTPIDMNKLANTMILSGVGLLAITMIVFAVTKPKSA